MFSRLSAFAALSALASVAIAIPTSITAHVKRDDQCNTGAMQCCNSLQRADSKSAGVLAGFLGIILDPTTFVGFDCSPISVIPVGGESGCSARPVCCTDNSHGNLISLGCMPVTL